jgi:hypothetical protein
MSAFEQQFIAILTQRIAALLTELGLHPGDAALMARAAYVAALARKKR